VRKLSNHLSQELVQNTSNLLQLPMLFTHRKLLVSVLLFGVLFPAQVTAQVSLDTGSIFAEVSSIISGMPGDSGNDYAAPSSTQLNSWGSVLNSVLQGAYTKASDTASILDYELIQFTDTTKTPNRTYYMLKSTGQNYWGTYIYNPNYSRPLVIQSPHPKKDFNTGKEGVHVFHETASFFFMLSGTSRCNNSAFSGCDGTTSICTGSSEDYRISDQAHILSTAFQSTTDTLFNKYSGTYFLQLHGFGKDSSDPFIILSNGTQDTPTVDYISTLKTNLEAEDSLFVDSIKVAHFDLSWTDLRGFTNVQGRLINSSVDPCDVSATTTNGRFIHMEQEKFRLRNTDTGWNKVSNAVINTFPSNSALPITLLHFNLHTQTDQKVICEWSTAQELNNAYFTIERSNTPNRWKEIATVDGANNSSQLLNYSYTDEHPYLGTSYYRLKQTDFDGNYSYSQTKSIRVNRLIHQVSVYPNPSKNHVILEANQEELEHIRMYTPLGENLVEKIEISVLSDSSVRLDLSKLAPGLYIIKTKTSATKVYKH